MGTYSVEVRDLIKYHGATLAVDHCSFSVKAGEFFSVIGPSGSGKTSTLRLLAGFEEPDHGAILIDGRSMARVAPNHRPVNLVFQHYALFPHLTVFKNVAFGLEMRHVAHPEVVSRVRAVLAMVKLGDKHDRFPNQLSGGEQQRVALARALVNRPAVVLLDEPLGALDQQLRQQMRVELKGIQEQVGLTFICVTHHQEEALTMSDRVAVMNRGRILQIGSPRDVYEAPASTFVANFVGQSNQVVGRILSRDAGICRLHAEGLPPIAIRDRAGLTVGEQITVMLRPERLDVSPTREHGGFDNVIPGRIETVIYNGSETHYWLRLTEDIVWMALTINARADHKRFAAGESVSVRWNAVDGVALTQ